MSRAKLACLAILAAALAAAGCGPDLPLSVPQWSLRGERAAFVRYGIDGGDLYVVNLAEGVPALVEKGVERFAFSPDGGRLYWLRPADAQSGRRAALVELDLAAGGGDAKPVPVALFSAEEGAALTGLGAAPDGKLFLVSVPAKGERALLELDPAAPGRPKALAPGAAEWFLLPAAALPRPALLLVAPGKEGTELSVRELPDGKPAAFGRLGPDLARLSPLGAAPDRLALAGLKGETRHLVLAEIREGRPEVRTFGLPRGDGRGDERGEPLPLAVCFPPEGAALRLSLAVQRRSAEDAEEIWTQSWELDPASGRWRRLAEAPGRLCGAPAWADRGGPRLEFTPGGLGLFKAGAEVPERLWPTGDEEVVAAVRLLLGAKKAAAAVDLVSAALDSAGPERDRAALHVARSEVLAAAGQAKDAADAYLESLLRYPVSGLRRGDREVAAQLARWIDEQPDNRILAMAAEGFRQRAGGNAAAAAAQFREAATFSSDAAWAAGLLFAAAEGLLQAGHGASAAELFRKASECAEFPQSDWAAGLCAVGYALGRREDLAAEEVMRCRDLHGRSPLAGDFRAMAEVLKSGERGKSSVLGNVAGPAGASVRLEAWPVLRAHVSFLPRPVPGGGADRRLALVTGQLHRVVLAPADGPQRALLDGVPLRLARLGFSPQGGRLAFLAGEEGATSLYAIDLAGKPLLGDLAGLLAGRTDPKTRASDYAWPAGRELPEAAAGE